MTSESISSTSDISFIITPSYFVTEIITANSFWKLSSSFFASDNSESSLIFFSSDHTLASSIISEIIDIDRSHDTGTFFTSTELRSKTTFPNSTTSVLDSNSFLSSFDTWNNHTLFSSETDNEFSPQISETSLVGTEDVRSKLLFSFTDGQSGTIVAITKPPNVPFTSRSTSNVNFYSTPASTIAVTNDSSVAVESSFQNIDFTVEEFSVPTSHTMIPHLLTSYTSNIGTISETQVANKESFFIRTETYRTNDQHARSKSGKHAIYSDDSSDFSSYTERTSQSITSFDTLMLKWINTDSMIEKPASIVQTYTPISNASVSKKELFLSESSEQLSTISFSDMTFETSFYESFINTSGLTDDIRTTNIQHMGNFSNTFLPPSRNISSSVSMITSDALMSTFIHALGTTYSQRIDSGVLQSSFYPAEHLFSSTNNVYLSTFLRQVSSMDNDISTVNNNVGTKGIVASEMQPSFPIVQNTNMSMISDSFIETTIKLSYLDSKSKHLFKSTMSDHLFSIRTADHLLMSTQHIPTNDLLYGSDTSFLLLPSSVLLFSDSISTTVHSTRTTRDEVSETTKNVIFISFVSGIIVIISVASVMLLARVILMKGNITFKEKSDNVSMDIDSQPVRKVFKEFPYTERSIYPRFSNTLSSYMTSPYDQNWNDV